MAMTIGSGKVTAAITGNVSFGIPTGATMVVRAANNVASGSTDVYTVTAGKTLYLLSVYICSQLGAVSQANYAEITADINGTGTYYALCAANCMSNGTVFGSGNNSATFAQPIPIPATKKIQIRCSASGAANGGFVGFEV